MQENAEKIDRNAGEWELDRMDLDSNPKPILTSNPKTLKCE